MNDIDLTKLLSILTKLTSQEKLHWLRTTPPQHYTLGTDNIYPDYYDTEYKNQRIGIGVRRFRDYDGDRDRLYWNEELYFLLVNSRDEVVWHKEGYLSALSVLFESVRDKASNIDSLVKDLLVDDDEL